MANLLIGLMGRMRCGKDTAARFMVEEHGFTRLAFADALRDMAERLDPLVGDDWGDGDRLSDELGLRGGWEGAKAHPEVRGTLQRLGVAVREVIGEDTWVDVVARKAAAIPGPVVVTDVRFRNEAAWINRAGGLNVRVYRPEADAAAGGVHAHVSERDLDNYLPDYELVNNSSLETLRARVASLVSDLTI